MTDAWTVTTHYLELPYYVQIDVLRRLHLVEEDDLALPANQLHLVAFTRAADLGLIGQLAAEVETRRRR